MFSCSIWLLLGLSSVFLGMNAAVPASYLSSGAQQRSLANNSTSESSWPSPGADAEYYFASGDGQYIQQVKSSYAILPCPFLHNGRETCCRSLTVLEATTSLPQNPLSDPSPKQATYPLLPLTILLLILRDHPTTMNTRSTTSTVLPFPLPPSPRTCSSASSISSSSCHGLAKACGPPCLGVILTVGTAWCWGGWKLTCRIIQLTMICHTIILPVFSRCCIPGSWRTGVDLSNLNFELKEMEWVIGRPS